MTALYRPNVAGIMMRQDGRILICERTNTTNAWQFPQGGIDEGENALTAVTREIEEEVGFAPDMYTILQSRGGYRYDYPAETLEYVRQKRKMPYVGQEQEYFLCELKENCPNPRIDFREFGQYKWINPGDFQLEWLPEFKREVYRQVFEDFFNLELV